MYKGSGYIGKMKVGTQRILAREFLILVGIILLALLCALVLWSRNGVLRRLATSAEAQLRSVSDTLGWYEKLNRYYVLIVDPLRTSHPGLTRRSPVWSGLTGMGYHLGSYSAFCDSLQDTTWYRLLYERVTKDGYDVGSYKTFAVSLGVHIGHRVPTWKPPAKDVSDDPFAEFGGEQLNDKMGDVVDGPFDTDSFLPASQPESLQALEWKRRVNEVAALERERRNLLAVIAGKRAAMMVPRQIWEFTGWMSLALMILLYPLRFLSLGTRWAIRTLQSTSNP